MKLESTLRIPVIFIFSVLLASAYSGVVLARSKTIQVRSPNHERILKITVTPLNGKARRLLKAKGTARFESRIHLDELQSVDTEALIGEVMSLTGGIRGRIPMSDCFQQDLEGVGKAGEILQCVAGERQNRFGPGRSTDPLSWLGPGIDESRVRQREGTSWDVGAGIRVNSNGDAEPVGCTGGTCRGVSDLSSSSSSGNGSSSSSGNQIDPAGDQWVREQIAATPVPSGGGETTSSNDNSGNNSGSSSSDDAGNHDSSSTEGDHNPPDPNSAVAMPDPEGGAGSVPSECVPAASNEAGTGNPSDPITHPSPDGGAQFATCFEDLSVRRCPADDYSTPDPDGDGGSSCDSDAREGDLREFRGPGWIDPAPDQSLGASVRNVRVLSSDRHIMAGASFSR